MSATEKQKHKFTVHTIGGEKLSIEASGYSIKVNENQVHFEDADENKEGQWIFFLSGIAAIHRERDKRIPFVAPVGVKQRNPFK